MHQRFLARILVCWMALLAMASSTIAQTTPRLKYEQALRELEQRNLVRAESLLRECLAQQQEPGQKALGKGEVLRYVPQLLLARVLADQGRLDEARRFLQEFERYPLAGQLGGEDLIELSKRLRMLPPPRLIPPLHIDASDGICRVRWEAVKGADGYRLETSTSATFREAPVARESTRLTYRILNTEVPSGETLFVRVAAESGDVVGEFSATAACVRDALVSGSGLRLEPEDGVVGPGEWVDVRWPLEENARGETVFFEVRCLVNGQEVSRSDIAGSLARCRASEAGTSLEVEVAELQAGQRRRRGRAVFAVQARVPTPTLRWEPAEISLSWPPVTGASRYALRWGRGEKADKLLGSITSCSSRRCEVSLGEFAAGRYTVQVIAFSASPSTHLDSTPAQIVLDIPNVEALRAFAQALELIHAGEYRRGLVALQPLQAEFSTSAKFHLYMGIAVFGCERLGELLPEEMGSSASDVASRLFRRAHELDPDVIFPVEVFGRLFHEAFLSAVP